MPFIQMEAEGRPTSCQHIFKSFSSPPVISVIMGAVIGCVPDIDEYIFNKTAPLKFLVDALILIGYVGIIFPLFFLGGNLYYFRNLKLPFSKRYLISIIIVKTLISPTCVLIYFVVLNQFTSIADNMPMAYQAFCSAIAPPSAVIIACTEMFNWANNEVSVIIFYVYLCCIPSIILFSYAFFLILM